MHHPKSIHIIGANQRYIVPESIHIIGANQRRIIPKPTKP